MILKNTRIILFLLLFLDCVAQNNTKNAQSIDEKVTLLLNKMTLQEKVGQMNQYNGFWDATGPTPKGDAAAHKYEHIKAGRVGAMLNVRGAKEVRALQQVAVKESRLGIPLLFGYDVIHGYKTISPIPLAEAASWDLVAIQKSAQMAAKEAAVAGLNWTFAPMVDISRDARWGRVMEGAGEDPYLGSQIGIARIHGFQGNNLQNPFSIAACAKHFAGYGFSESGRDYNTVDVSNNTLHNIILPPFMAAVKADVKTFMNAFNEFEGIPSTANAYLQRELLKGTWNYKGFVVSDWGSIVEMVNHGNAQNLKKASEYAALAGCDMDMESYGYVSHLEELVEKNKVDISIVDDAVRRILKVKFELGLFNDPFLYCDENREAKVTGSQEIHDAVLDMAKKSIVLLKNQNNLLPLPKSGKKIAFIGDFVKDKTSPLGSWRIGTDDETAISLWEGLQSYKDNTYTYAKGVTVAIGRKAFMWETKINETDRTGINEAVDTAKNADVVVMMLGEHGLQSGEGRSRTELDLPGLQQELLEAVYKVNKNIVLVLTNGRPLAIEWADENIPAILETWHLGTQSGNAIASVLFGDYNPSGKLPMTFPRNVGQVPIYYNYKNTGRPAASEKESVFWSHYIDSKNTPLYPFGHGLSYTTFRYDAIELSSNKMENTDTINVNVTLTNTGKVEGEEVVQLYLRDLVASTTRPVRELKDFRKITLTPNETKKISFKINKDELAFYTKNKKWETEAGTFKVFVGGSSMTVLEADFELIK